MTDCAGCEQYDCYRGDPCTRGQDDLQAYAHPTKKIYEAPGNLKALEVSTAVEGEHYMEWTRLEEVMGYARGMGYRKIGIAHCVGLTREARVLKDILEREFEVHAICCKFSGVDKQSFGLKQIDNGRYEAICNSVGQAMVLNDLGTELNLIVGLCIGHDILFTQHSKAPVTTFIVKDRVLGHNPAVALYSNYYKRRLGG
jgi:uncharacterized metal-binding protein